MLSRSRVPKYKVAALDRERDGGTVHYDFQKSVWGTRVSGYCDEYVEARERVGESFLTLKDGRRVCYFVDGDAPTRRTSDSSSLKNERFSLQCQATPILFLHGDGEGKFQWLQKESLPGVYQIAIDRMGYGGSDMYLPRPEDYDFRVCADDVAQGADLLLGKGESFILCGFSIGSTYALQIACQIPERIRGLILFGPLVDSSHPDMSSAVLKGVGGKPCKLFYPVSGCFGCVSRKIYKNYVDSNQRGNFEHVFQSEKRSRRTKKIWNVFKVDDFWVCSKVDSLSACNRAKALLVDMHRNYCEPWPFDIRNIPRDVPVAIIHGEGDVQRGSKAPEAPEFIRRCIPHATVEYVEGCGHLCIVGPYYITRDQILQAVERMPYKMSRR